MTPHSKTPRLAVWLGLVLQATASLCFHGLVLCVSANGHVAVEWLAAADCCPEESGSATLAPGDCCGCTDAPLLLRAVGTRAAVDPNESAASTPFAGVGVLPSSHPLTALSSGPPDYALPPPQARVARRSVLLQL